MLEAVYNKMQEITEKKLTPWSKLQRHQQDQVASLVEAVKLVMYKNPLKFKAIVYDIELANDPKAIGGWDAYDKMEISCIGTYDYETDQYRIFQHDEIGECIEFLHSSKMIIGFNNVGFDDNVMKARGLKVGKVKSFDILREIWKAKGLDPDNTSPMTHGGTGLDRTSTLTFGNRKSGQGAHAIKLWEERKVGELYSYCLNDVRLTKKLMDRIARGEPINSGKPSQVLNIHFDSTPFLGDAEQSSLF